MISILKVYATPDTEYIPTQYYNKEDFKTYCPFCGKALIRHSEGWGRDKMVWHDDCSCPGARAAQEHNARYERIMNEQNAHEKAAEKPKVSASTTASVPKNYGPKSFAALVSLLQEKGLYAMHQTVGEAISLDGIMSGYMDGMHHKLAIIDESTGFFDYDWDLCVSFMSEKSLANPVMRVVQELSDCGRPFQHVVVTDIKKAQKLVKNWLN